MADEIDKENKSQEQVSIVGALDKPSSSGRGEVSAATLGRMLGLATVSELNVIESKLDLLASKINQSTAKMEKILGILQKAPSGADLERIDVQIATLKAAVIDFVTFAKGGVQTPETKTEATTILQADSVPLEDDSPIKPTGKKVTLSSLKFRE